MQLFRFFFELLETPLRVDIYSILRKLSLSAVSWPSPARTLRYCLTILNRCLICWGALYCQRISSSRRHGQAYPSDPLREALPAHDGLGALGLYDNAQVWRGFLGLLKPGSAKSWAAEMGCGLLAGLIWRS